MRSTPSPAITAFCPSLLSSLWARCCTSAFCPKQSTPSSKFDKIFDSHYNIGVYSVQVHLGNIPLFKVYLKTKKMPVLRRIEFAVELQTLGLLADVGVGEPRLDVDFDVGVVDEDCRHVAYFVRRVVEAWEERSHERHQRADHNAE